VNEDLKVKGEKTDRGIHVEDMMKPTRYQPRSWPSDPESLPGPPKQENWVL
jgi:hypothetical protein